MSESTEITREAAIEIVEASPRLVGEHDRVAWQGLFAADGVVEDPVGAAPSRKGKGLRRGSDELARFYDTFIAGNAIRFVVERDIVVGSEVIRDVAIHTTLGTGLQVMVPAILRYSLVREGGDIRIARLEAYWELPRMSKQILQRGPRGLRTMLRTTWTMLRVQGLRGLTGYSKGMIQGIFSRGRRTAARLARLLAEGDLEGIAGLFVPGADIESLAQDERDHVSESPVAWADRLGSGACLSLAKIIASGFVVAFRFELQRGDEASRGVGFLIFDRETRKIDRARFFFA
ncbi:MAG TPA: hypothetical protein ENJ18_10595 [Nannocystis exedens]|nr:hypothetical protein [Nannocystis exedens]